MNAKQDWGLEQQTMIFKKALEQVGVRVQSEILDGTS
jgi:hypothetical protein